MRIQIQKVFEKELLWRTSLKANDFSEVKNPFVKIKNFVDAKKQLWGKKSFLKIDKIPFYNFWKVQDTRIENIIVGLIVTLQYADRLYNVCAEDSTVS